MEIYSVQEQLKIFKEVLNYIEENIEEVKNSNRFKNKLFYYTGLVKLNSNYFYEVSSLGYEFKNWLNNKINRFDTYLSYIEIYDEAYSEVKLMNIFSEYISYCNKIVKNILYFVVESDEFLSPVEEILSALVKKGRIEISVDSITSESENKKAFLSLLTSFYILDCHPNVGNSGVLVYRIAYKELEVLKNLIKEDYRFLADQKRLERQRRNNDVLRSIPSLKQIKIINGWIEYVIGLFKLILNLLKVRDLWTLFKKGIF